VRVLLVAVLGSTALPSALHAQTWTDGDYARWYDQHALDVLTLLQLPTEFTLADLRDLTIEQRRLIDEARAVEPPPALAAVHAAYLEAMDAVAAFQGALQTVVLTRAAVPGLASAALTGAAIMLASDLAAQHLFGVALPVGVATGVVGGLYLAWLLGFPKFIRVP